MGDGGGGGIRTHETVARLPVFKTGAFNHSATPPDIARPPHLRLAPARNAQFFVRRAHTFLHERMNRKHDDA